MTRPVSKWVCCVLDMALELIWTECECMKRLLAKSDTGTVFWKNLRSLIGRFPFCLQVHPGWRKALTVEDVSSLLYQFEIACKALILYSRQNYIYWNIEIISNQDRKHESHIPSQSKTSSSWHILSTKNIELVTTCLSIRFAKERATMDLALSLKQMLIIISSGSFSIVSFQSDSFSLILFS